MSDQNKDNQDEFEAIFPDDARQNGAQGENPVEGNYSNDFDVVQPVEDISDEPDYKVPERDGGKKSAQPGEDYLSNSDSTSAIEDDLHDFSDIDDGVDESGIFATPTDGRKKRKKSSSPALMAGVVLLAVGGVGGYFYHKNPEIFTQIKGNFVNDSGMSGALANLNDMLGGASETGGPITVSPADVVAGDMPPQPMPYSEDTGTAQETSSSAPDAESVVADVPVMPQNEPPFDEVVMDLPQPTGVDENGADENSGPVVIGAMPDDVIPDNVMPADVMPDNVMVGDVPVGILNEQVNNVGLNTHPEEISVPTSAETVVIQPEVPEGNVVATDSVPRIEESVAPVVVEIPSTESPAAPADIVTPSSDVTDIIPPVVPEGGVVVVDKAAEKNVEKSGEVVEKVDPNKGNAKIFKPTETVKHKVRLVDDISSEKAPNDSELAGVSSAGEKTAKKSEADLLHEELAMDFFDAPPGKILDAMPAPAMDVKRGKTESIIVVHDAKSKGGITKASTSSKSSKSTPIQIETTSLDSKVIAADRALKLGRIDSAKEMFEELYNMNPREPRVLMGRAIIYQKTGENARAISTYEELLAISPNNAEAVINLAGLIRSEQPAVALSRLLELRQKFPDNATIVAQLAISYADSGNLDDALNYLDKAIAMQSNNAQHYFNRAILSERAGRIGQAISFYEKALEVDAIQGGVSGLPRDVIYDRLARLRVAR
ncbi:MAG: tetratricopeptide repeat protein [Pseudobdellovibrionaceae bacterium]|jgi:Tfp pilus assembly protein PilF|nr:tetratricopeptide repeat protein [Pseudobdellovibrionaceae bacterium]